jgi:hypothetical protein
VVALDGMAVLWAGSQLYLLVANNHALINMVSDFHFVAFAQPFRRAVDQFVGKREPAQYLGLVA